MGQQVEDPVTGNQGRHEVGGSPRFQQAPRKEPRHHRPDQRRSIPKDAAVATDRGSSRSSLFEERARARWPTNILHTDLWMLRRSGQLAFRRPTRTLTGAGNLKCLAPGPGPTERRTRGQDRTGC